jgi:hypothetical protein
LLLGCLSLLLALELGCLLLFFDARFLLLYHLLLLYTFVDCLHVSDSSIIKVFCDHGCWVPLQVVKLVKESLSLLHDPWHNVLVHRDLSEIVSEESDIL